MTPTEYDYAQMQQQQAPQAQAMNHSNLQGQVTNDQIDALMQGYAYGQGMFSMEALNRQYVDQVNAHTERMIEAIREVAPDRADQIEYLFREKLMGATS